MILWLCILFCGLPASAASVDELSKANNAFAVDLYKQIGDANNGKNLFFSPISISTAFGMVSLGTRGTTREQTKAVLHLDKISSDETVKEAFKQLLTAFKDQANNYTLHMVNRLFGSAAFEFHDQFIQETQIYFEASLERLDFVGKAEESRRHINEWVEEQTNQKIRDLLPGGTIDAQTILVIVNAIYFKALWVFPFGNKLTELGPFRLSKAQMEDVEMMHLNDEEYLNYHNSSELKCEVLELPYQGNKASMFVFLPYDVDGLPNLEKQLTGVKLTDTLSKVQRQNMVVQLPKFSIDQDIALKKFLHMMGMVDLFGDSADLSGIGSGRLAVTDAIHKAFVNVSESGTEAAAATGIIIGLTSAYNPSPTNFIVDRPFLFLIYEKNTQSVLFMGRLVKPPTAKESIGKFGETAALHSTAVLISDASFTSLCSLVLLLSVNWSFP